MTKTHFLRVRFFFFFSFFFLFLHYEDHIVRFTVFVVGEGVYSYKNVLAEVTHGRNLKIQRKTEGKNEKKEIEKGIHVDLIRFVTKPLVLNPTTPK